jgi:acetoin utilization deacetylase AcuC-like enzyme
MHDLVYFYPDGHPAHREPGHPERPERIEAMVAGLETAGWWQPYPKLAPLELSPDLLGRVHTPAYLAQLERACKTGARLDADTYTTPATWQLSLNAAGGSAATAAAVWRGQARRAFALARPPGHHAQARRGMGFCLLNNIAIAAEYLRSQPFADAPNPERLAIVDLDLHHGNGTQDIFWQRGDVLFISAHQSPLYPGTGDLDETGVGQGQDATANIPLPPMTGDLGFAAMMDTLILPLLDRFAPQMLLVSFGFDPHWRDPLGGLSLSAAGLGGLVAALTEWAESYCNGKIALFLEGGYDLEVGKACAQSAVAALLSQTWQDPIGPAPYPETTAWQGVVGAAQRQWYLPVTDSLDKTF